MNEQLVLPPLCCVADPVQLEGSDKTVIYPVSIGKGHSTLVHLRNRFAFIEELEN